MMVSNSVMTALLELGAFLGAMQAGFISDKISRKRTIMVGACWFVVGSALQAGSKSFAMLVIGRFIGGIGVGVLSSTAPTYISEIAPPNVRGAFLALEGSSIVIGIVIMLPPATSWTAGVSVCLSPSRLFLVSLLGLVCGCYPTPPVGWLQLGAIKMPSIRSSVSVNFLPRILVFRQSGSLSAPRLFSNGKSSSTLTPICKEKAASFKTLSLRCTLGSTCSSPTSSPGP